MDFTHPFTVTFGQVFINFDNMNTFSEGLCYARVGDTHGYINTSGSFEIQKPVTKPTLIDKLRKRGDWLRW